MKSRECACGCDRDVPLPLTGVNAQARTVQVELLEWDRARHFMLALAHSPNGNAGYDGQLDPFIEAGAEHYQAMLRTIHHTEFFPKPLDSKAIKRWLKFSRKQRRKMGRNTALVRPEKELQMRTEDLDALNPLFPERSFTGPDPDGSKFADESGVMKKGGENG
jgi:hypothetical protein